LPDDIGGTAVLEYRPTEITAPVCAISTSTSCLCRPQRRTPPRNRGFFDL